MRRTDLGPVIRALWDRVAGLLRLFPGVPLSGVPPSDGGLTMVSILAHAGADIDELRFLYGGRLFGGISSAIGINYEFGNIVTLLLDTKKSLIPTSSFCKSHISFDNTHRKYYTVQKSYFR